jgi:thymidylate synthase
MELLSIEASTISDAWFQAVYSCVEKGREFIIDRGSYAGQKRLEFDYITVKIKMPWIDPLEPQLPGQYNIPDPVPEGYLGEYLPYLMTGKKKVGESYTYGQRICMCPIREGQASRYLHGDMATILIQEKEVWRNPNIIVNENGITYLNQMELLIWIYKNKGHRNNQMVMQVAQPTDMLLQDPPCLRHIDTRVQDGVLHFFPYFRSWDLWGGFPANLGALELMKQYMASEIGVSNGEIIAASKGLHLYSYVWELAELLRGKTIQEFKKGK